MVKEIIKFSSSTDYSLRFFVSALRGCKVPYRIFQVDVLHKHSYFVILVPTRIQQRFIEVASILRLVLMPFPLVDSLDELKDRIYKYTLNVPW